MNVLVNVETVYDRYYKAFGHVPGIEFQPELTDNKI